jgi:TetR/AcrR family transcriptional regulator
VEGTAASTRTSSPARGIAVKLWSAARTEFSLRGYHGARVQGIARRAGCNVALLYRHWSSKKALYLEVLKSVWIGKSEAVVHLLEQQGGGAPTVVSAYFEALLADPEGAQILVREYLDGGPFLSLLVASDPDLVEPVRRAAEALASGNGASLRLGLDPVLAALTIGGLAALVASAQDAARPFLEREVTLQEWRRHLSDLLLNGLLRCQEQVMDAGGPAAVSRGL